MALVQQDWHHKKAITWDQLGDKIEQEAKEIKKQREKELKKRQEVAPPK